MGNSGRKQKKGTSLMNSAYSRYKKSEHHWILHNRISVGTKRAKTTFKIWNFYFSQILTGIVEKHILTSFYFFFKFSHCLTLFSTLSVHVNWIVFHTFKFCYRQILRSNESWTWNNEKWIWKMIVNETGDYAKAALCRCFSK